MQYTGCVKFTREGVWGLYPLDTSLYMSSSAWSYCYQTSLAAAGGIGYDGNIILQNVVRRASTQLLKQNISRHDDD